MIGVVNLDKPVGPTSHDMVGLLRRLSAMRRIGHAGTLDPLASGVLPILVGAATRLSQDLTGGRKRYDAVVRLGIRSRTDDGEGPMEPGSAPPPPEVVEAALAEFVGAIQQRPPTYSARQHEGVRAHRAARRGADLDLPPREVTVHAIRLLGATPTDGALDVHLDIETGPGAYIRSIARDLGERLGCGGYLVALRRTRAAGLDVADAWTPEALEALTAAGRFADALLPVESVLDLPAITLGAEDARRFVHGGDVAADGAGRSVVRGPEGVLGIGLAAGGRLHPRTVLVEAS